MKTLTILEWRLIPWSNKGFGQGSGLETYIVAGAVDSGKHVHVVVFDGDKRVSWLNRDPPKAL
jgi:hypothetical protein